MKLWLFGLVVVAIVALFAFLLKGGDGPPNDTNYGPGDFGVDR